MGLLVPLDQKFDSLLGYFQLIFAVGVSFLRGTPVIDKNDPLEAKGPLFVERVGPLEVPFNKTTTEEDTVKWIHDNNPSSLLRTSLEDPGGGDDNSDYLIDIELFVPTTTEDDPDNDDIFCPHAFVLFLPGFGTGYESYQQLINHMTSHGYFVVGMNFPQSPLTFDSEHDVQALMALEVIRYVQALDINSILPRQFSSSSCPAISTLPVITAGHSRGGKIAFYAASNSTDIISGVIGLDPVNAGGPPCFLGESNCQAYPVAPNIEADQRGLLYLMQGNNVTSTLILRSAPDFLTNPDDQFNAELFYFGSNGEGLDGSPSPSLYYDLDNYPHSGYIDFFQTVQIQIMKRTMVAWLQQRVLGIDNEEYLTGERIQKDVDDGYLTSVQFR